MKCTIVYCSSHPWSPPQPCPGHAYVFAWCQTHNCPPNDKAPGGMCSIGWMESLLEEFEHKHQKD